MSSEFMAFDPSGLDGMSGDPLTILRAVQKYHDETMEAGPPWPKATPAMAAFIDRTDVMADLYSGGRYASFMVTKWKETREATMLHLAEAAQAAGVIFIDAEGQTPVLTTPSGDGLLD